MVPCWMNEEKTNKKGRQKKIFYFCHSSSPSKTSMNRVFWCLMSLLFVVVMLVVSEIIEVFEQQWMSVMFFPYLDFVVSVFLFFFVFKGGKKNKGQKVQKHYFFFETQQMFLNFWGFGYDFFPTEIFPRAEYFKGCAQGTKKFNLQKHPNFTFTPPEHPCTHWLRCIFCFTVFTFIETFNTPFTPRCKFHKCYPFSVFSFSSFLIFSIFHFLYFCRRIISRCPSLVAPVRKCSLPMESKPRSLRFEFSSYLFF